MNTSAGAILSKNSNSSIGGCWPVFCPRCGNVSSRCICRLTAANGQHALYSPTSNFEHGTAETHTGGREFQQHSIDHRYCDDCGRLYHRCVCGPRSSPQASACDTSGRWPSAPDFFGARG